MWVLREESADKAGQPLTFRLMPDSMKTIGRMRNADFVIEQTLVSRIHCRLTNQDGHLEVEDLDSANGTYVNNQKIQRARLASGDKLRIGQLELVVSNEPIAD
jgi:pSer/pThr/pTyr-binding forkhead associated (FHA) protein